MGAGGLPPIPTYYSGRVNNELLDLLAADLDAAGYRHDAIAALLGEENDAARQAGVLAPARLQVERSEATPLALLTQLFLLGGVLDAGELDEVLPSLGYAGARQLGLIERETDEDEIDVDREDDANDVFFAAVSLNAVIIADEAGQAAGPADSPQSREWLVLSDLDDHLRGGPAQPDHVMGIGGATRSLIAQLPIDRVGTALDLGTGCGIVAMHLALRADRVVATDISERALMFARANLRLNGITSEIELRSGSLFEPVAGETFDLIASNPPFVITPRAAGETIYEYRDGGRTGDALAEEVVAQGPAHLATGGTLVCLANWESHWGQNGLGRVERWIAAAADTAAAPLTAWVIERDKLTPLGYGQMWARDGGDRPGTEAYDERLTAWLEDFSARRVVRVGLGSIRIARAAGAEASATVHLDEATGAFAQTGVASGLAAAFEAGAHTAALSDEAVLATTWIRDAAVREEREHVPGVEAPSAITLVTDSPIARRVAADPLLAAAVGACDGDLTLGQIADALAMLLEVEEGAARAALVASARELSWLGMLAPAATPEG